MWCMSTRGRILPIDIAVINTELALADLQQLERRLEKLEREVKGDRKLLPLLEMARQVEAQVGAGKPLRGWPQSEHPDFIALNQEMRFLTSKPLIYAANTDEDNLQQDNKHLVSARLVAVAEGAELISVCASLESEMASFSEGEQAEYLGIVRPAGKQPRAPDPQMLSTIGSDQLFHVQRK